MAGAKLVETSLKTGEAIGTALKNLVKKKQTTPDPLALPAGSNPVGKYTQSMHTQTTGTNLLKKYPEQPSAQMKAYQNELADIRAGKTTTAAPAKQQQAAVSPESKQGVKASAETPTTQKLTDETTKPGKQTLTPTKKENTGAGKYLLKSIATPIGVAGLTAAGLVGIPQLFSHIPGADGDNEGGNQGGNQNGGNNQGGLWEIIHTLFGGGQNPGGTYYLGGGNDPGEPGSSEMSIINEAAEAISSYLPYILVGVGILVLILAITKNGKKSGKPSAAKKTAKKGGSHA